MSFSTSSLPRFSSSTHADHMLQPTLSDTSTDIFSEPVQKHDPLWKDYVEKATSFDKRIIEDWNKIVDVTLVFVGLIIAVLTSFVIDTSQQFEPNPAVITNKLLIAIYDQLVAQANNTSLPRINIDAILELDKSDYNHAFTCNALLYGSLALCSVAAVLALAAKLWVISYGERTSAGGTPYERAINRQAAYSGVLVWKMGGMIHSIPLILLIALVVFGYFVHVSIWSIQQNIGYGVGTILTLSVIALGITSLAAAFIPACPYSSSISAIIQVMFDYTRKALKLVSRRWNTPSSRMTLVIFSWFASGSLIAFATIKFSSAFYLLVFIPISITFEYSMKKQVKHKPQKHRLPRLSLWVSMIITPLLAAAGYFRNPQKYHIFVILYIVGMLVLFFYGWMASRMSKSLDGTAEIDAITWLLKLETSPNPELFEKACRIVSSDSGRDYQPKVLESLMHLLSSVIASHRPDMEPKDLETYVSCLAYLAKFKDEGGSWSRLKEDARKHPKLEEFEELRKKLVELAKHQSPVGRDAGNVLRSHGWDAHGQKIDVHIEKPLLHKRQISGDAASVMTFVESAHSYEDMELHSRHKGGYYSVDA